MAASPAPPSSSSPTDIDSSIPSSTSTPYAKAIHNLSLALLVVCPAVLALPPRRLDLYAFSLSTAWVLSLNHLTAERTGRGILAHLQTRAPQLPQTDSLPSERARGIQERLQRERMLRQGKDEARGPGTLPGRGQMERLWMGEETEGWRERRLEEERQRLASGEGYGGMIVDQIWEVWNRSKGRGGPEERRLAEEARRGGTGWEEKSGEDETGKDSSGP